MDAISVTPDSTMAINETICNLALRHLGVGKTVTNFSTDTTPEARACQVFLQQAIDETVRAFAWPFLTKFATLTLIETDPTVEWTYSYRLPTDCSFVRRIVQADSSRNETRQSRAPFRVVRDTASTEWSAATTYAVGDYASITTSGVPVWYIAIQAGTNQNPATQTAYWTAVAGMPPMLLLTDKVDCEIEYTIAPTSITGAPDDYIAAVAALLAFYIAPSIKQDETGKAGQREMGLFNLLISRAQANAANEEVPDDPQPSEFERSRFM